jgi:hypothetical protein
VKIETKFTAVLLVLLTSFIVLNVFSVQPGEDNHRWLLYLFLFGWPILSVATLVVALRAARVGFRTAIVALAVSVLSLTCFIIWGRMYAGLW